MRSEKERGVWVSSLVMSIFLSLLEWWEPFIVTATIHAKLNNCDIYILPVSFVYFLTAIIPAKSKPERERERHACSRIFHVLIIIAMFL